MKTIEISREELNEMLLAQTSADLATILATAIEKGLDTNRPYRYAREPDGGLIFEQEEPGDFEVPEPAAQMPVGDLPTV